jgi:hypothetical protein
VPTKKKSCELVQQAIAGPAPDQILDAIRAEYWLPQDSRQKPQARKSEPTPENTNTPNASPQVKP